MNRRLKSAGVTLGMVLTAGVGFACASGEPDQEFMDAEYGQVCMEQATEIRSVDDECDDGDADDGFLWVYLGRPHSSPPVGSKLTSGTYLTSRPSSALISRVPSSGGFGGKVAVGGG